MDYIEGADRFQMEVSCLDDMVAAGSHARAIDRFIDGLDLAALGFSGCSPKATGRQPYDPACLAKLLVWGYLKGVRSSRRLEEACHVNLEAMWLMRRLAPDHKTVAEFRRRNLAPLKALFSEFGSFADFCGLFGKRTVAIDGTKVRASNSKKRAKTQRALERDIRHHEARAEEWLGAMAEADGDAERGRARERAGHHRRRAEECGELLGAMREAGVSEVSLTDPDARSMGDKYSAIRPSYNVQASVDALHHMAAAVSVTNAATDQASLAPMVEASQEALRVRRLRALADKGYWSGEGIAAAQGMGADTVVCPQGAPAPKGGWPSDMFSYDPEADSYTCPEGRELHAHSGKDAKQRSFHSKEACAACGRRRECTGKDGGFRRLSRGPAGDVLDAARARYEENTEAYALRQQVVEHVFGTVKCVQGLDRFLLRGTDKADCEAHLSLLGYNIKRAANVLGLAEMTALMEEYFALLREHGVIETPLQAACAAVSRLAAAICRPWTPRAAPRRLPAPSRAALPAAA